LDLYTVCVCQLSTHPAAGGPTPFSRPTHLTGATPPPLPTLTTSHRAPATAPNPAPYLGELSATRWHRHAYPAGNSRPPPAADHRLRANPQPAAPLPSQCVAAPPFSGPHRFSEQAQLRRTTTTVLPVATPTQLHVSRLRLFGFLPPLEAAQA
jgi:hypothetical protein